MNAFSLSISLNPANSRAGERTSRESGFLAAKIIAMKRNFLTLLISAFIAQSSEADLVPGGDFQMYKPGTNHTVTATFGVGTNSFARGVGDGIELAGGTVSYSDGGPDGVAGDGIPDIDMPGWVPLQSGNDLFGNGVGGSNGMNLFAAWGGDGRIRSEPLGTVQAGNVYTISVMVGGPDSGPIQGPLAFHLAADGVQLTPSEIVDPTLPNGGAFQEISRTYDASSIAGHIGAEMTIVLGVEDANDFPNRVIFDDVSLVVDGPGVPFTVTEIVYAPESEQVILTWRDTGAEAYAVTYSTDLTSWDSDLDDGITAADDEIPDDGDKITKTFDIPGLAEGGRLFFRVEER
jgi:hypothetical protein